MVLMVATQKLRYAAKEFLTGDTFEASDKDSKILIAIGKAQTAPPPAPRKVTSLPEKTAPTPAPAPVSTVAAAPKVADVIPPTPAPAPDSTFAQAPKALPPEPATPASEPPVEPDRVPTSTTSRYKRRDLQPEG